MSTKTWPWELPLLARAHEALNIPAQIEPVAVGRDLLTHAYARCEEITRQHSRTFYLASALLPKAERQAMRALYAFCRISDDLVDTGNGDEAPLRAWQQRALADHPYPDDPVALAWADTRARYHIPHRYAEQLIEGVAQDLRVTRYDTFDQLAVYSYNVAATVGLMAMHIVGFNGPEAIPYAVRLGVALQLTNILRDVGADWRQGRLYLPRTELANFGLSEEDIAVGRTDDRWRNFLRFQIRRTRFLYTQGLPGLAMLHPRGRFAIGAAGELYRAILDEIETHDYDVFHQRVHVGRWEKVRRLPGIWWLAQRAHAP